MTTSKDDLSAACKALLGRKRRWNAERTAQLRVYSKSLIQRFKAIQYAYDEIWGLHSAVIGLAAGTTESIPDPAERLDFYANAFWAFGYSLFDVLANVINVVHPVSKDESKVAFVQAAKNYEGLSGKSRGALDHLPDELLALLQGVIEDQTFKRLAGYRQCCLHRREVCLGEDPKPRPVTRAYVGTTGINVSEIVFLVCDNPHAMYPKFESKRRLLDECEAVGKFVKRELIAILRIL